MLQSAVGAALAYTIAMLLLGHPYPFFAAVAAFVCLGLTDERRLRRVAELAAGVTLGVLVGDAFVLLAGSGPLQIAVVLAVTVLIALFLDGGQLVATQAGVQALLVVALPPSAGGPFSRWQDAFIGSLVALLVATLLPSDPRVLPRTRGAELLGELSVILGLVAKAVRQGDPVLADRALVRSRDTQPKVDQLSAAVRGAQEITRIAPLRRRHAAEVARLATVWSASDKAVRNTRVVARRAARAIEDRRTLPKVAHLLERTCSALDLLTQEVATGGTGRSAAAALSFVAADLAPGRLVVDDVHAEALVVLLRSLVVDLLEASGMDHADARALLPAT